MYMNACKQWANLLSCSFTQLLVLTYYFLILYRFSDDMKMHLVQETIDLKLEDLILLPLMPRRWMVSFIPGSLPYVAL